MDTDLKSTDNSNINYYQDYKEKLILRDVLAADRTILANERTCLSYIRTALNFAIAGISVIKIFDGLGIYLLGSFFILSSVIILIIGIRRYFKIRKDINLVRR